MADGPHGDVMNSMTEKGLSVSPITIGTVQFGISYGLKENAEAASQEEVNKALCTMRQRGINSLDTAAAYGDSEEKIGNWMNNQQDYQKLIVATKIHGLDVSSEKAVIISMRDKIRQSAQRLGLSCIPVLMIHHFDEYLAHRRWFDKAFCVMKEDGLIILDGVSAYSTDDYFQIADSKLDAVQIPVNLLDWEQMDSGGLRTIKDSGMLVYARSVYLQGLLLRNPEALPARMAFASETLTKYVELCGQFGLSQREMALSFVRSLPEISSVVIGCRNAEQVESNAETFFNLKKLSEEQLEIIRDSFKDTEKRVIVPTLW